MHAPRAISRAVEHLSLELLRKHLAARKAQAARWHVRSQPGAAARMPRPHWQNLLCLNPRDIRGGHHTRTTQERGARAPAGDFRHIAICGVSFCGSTLMDRLLGSLPGSANIAGVALAHLCAAAGRPCADRFRRAPYRRAASLQRMRIRLPGLEHGFSAANSRPTPPIGTAGIAHRLDTQTLISADKNPPKLADHDPLLRFDALRCSKAPSRRGCRCFAGCPQDRDAAFYLRKCETYLELWTDRYRTLLDHFAPQGKVVFLQFDAFAQAPREVLRSLCAALDLTFDASRPRKPPPCAIP